MTEAERTPGPELDELANGVRVLVLPQPRRRTAEVSVFVRSGSVHEPRGTSGLSHVVEHMAFKGTAQRDCHRINLDAERLGAEVNAHTDKDHTAFHMHGLPADAPEFVRMLADIVRHAAFPEDELERERAVLLQELEEVEDDPMAAAYAQLDRAAWGLHPAAAPVIGQRRHIEAVTRADLLRYVGERYTGANIVVAAAGALDAELIGRAAARHFGDMPRGVANTVDAPVFRAELRSRAIGGAGQAHLALGFEAPPLGEPDLVSDVAAAVFGEGMSSPLLAELRERRGLLYHAACAVDRFAFGGQFVVEASMAPARIDDVLGAVAELLARQADRVTAADLERARKQLTVRRLRDDERPGRALEEAALQVLTRGQPVDARDWLRRLAAVDAASVRGRFETMLGTGAAAALTGQIGRRAGERLARGLAAMG